jgi:hypothetical protein
MMMKKMMGKKIAKREINLLRYLVIKADMFLIPKKEEMLNESDGVVNY